MASSSVLDVHVPVVPRLNRKWGYYSGHSQQKIIEWISILLYESENALFMSTCKIYLIII